MKKGKYNGIITPLITPFNGKGEIDFKGFESLLLFLKDKVDGFFVNATTGEFTSLSIDERIEVLKFVKSVVKEDKLIFSHITSTSIKDIEKIIKASHDLKVNAIVITPPYYLIPDRDGIKNFFYFILKISNLDLLIYNIPSCTGYSLSVDIIKEIAFECERLKGVKATIDSLSYIKDLISIKEKREDFSVLTGVELYLAPTLLSHGDGGIVALSNFAPLLLKEIILNFENKNFENFIESHRKVMKLFEIYKYSSSFASAIKIALNLLGFPISKKVRVPLIEDSEEKVEKIKDILISLGLM
ncbi:MAG: dihydrodipicolinate synthase family protein [Caldisericia bacterium]|jgi:4-hydroxy-tetrahydrodipicolinate synthase|nr:dihydrodipicolinate synthase family protein [Caldisericia bacterium]